MTKNLPLNPAVCLHCGSKDTKRIGYSDLRGASIWQCMNPDCKRQFAVPTLRLAKKVG